MRDITISLLQLRPQRDVSQSLEDIRMSVAQAAHQGADMVVLTECAVHPYELTQVRTIAGYAKESLRVFSEIAIEHGIYLCSGSLFVQEGNSLFNRAHLFGPTGEVLLTHDKVHLYDVDFGNLRTKESLLIHPGTSFQAVDTELGRIGMLVCYDIRFPEAVRSMGGCDLLVVPAAFNRITGPAHWNLLFQGRALENQCYVAACSPARDDESSYVAYGHSLLVDPWGEVMAEAGEGVEMITGRISGAYLTEVREKLPLLKHRRPDVYTL